MQENSKPMLKSFYQQTVKPVYSAQLQFHKKCSLSTGIFYIDVSSYGGVVITGVQKAYCKEFRDIN